MPPSRSTECGDRFEIASFLAFRGVNLKKINSRFQLSNFDIEEGRKLVMLDIQRIEDLFKKDIFYIEPNGANTAKSMYDGVKDYLNSGHNIDAPLIELYKAGNSICVGFIDGRHRFSVLRDMGMRKMPFSLNENSAKLAEEYGFLA